MQLITVLNLMGEGVMEDPRDKDPLPLCIMICDGNCVGDLVSIVDCRNCPLELYPDLIMDIANEAD